MPRCVVDKAERGGAQGACEIDGRMLPESPELNDLFSPSSYDAWAAAVAEAEGDALRAARRLTRKTLDGTKLRALYTADDAVSVADAGQAPFTRGRSVRPAPGGWLRCQRIASADGSLAHAVRDGATAIAWEAAKPVTADALGALPLDLAAVLPVRSAYEDALVSAMASRGCRGDTLGLDPLGYAAQTGTAARALPDALRAAVGQTHEHAWSEDTFPLLVDVTVYHHAGATDAQVLGFALASHLELLRAAEARGVDPGWVAKHTACQLPLTPKVWSSVARLRVMRTLWSHVQRACGIEPAPLWVHGVPSLRVFTRRAAENNILRNTLAMIGGALGGADMLTSLPFDVLTGASDESERLALMTQHMLAEEARFEEQVDLAGGAWRLEAQSAALAKTAWAVAQAIEARGGMAEALASGWVAEQVAGVSETRRERVETRSDGIVGVSRYVVATDTQKPTKVAAPPLAATRVCSPLSLTRDAEAYEQLVDASHAATEGPVRACVYTLGEAARHEQRATWVTHVLASGGFDVVRVPEGEEPPAGLWVLVCGSDAALAAAGPERVKRLKDGGASAVTVVGLRGADATRWEEAGADVLREGVNVVRRLRRALSQAGVRV